MGIYLSIDFDFFSREDPLWDFGHNESNSAFSGLVWPMRVVGMGTSGVDLIDETSLDRFARPHPRNFWATLVELGFRFNQCKFFSVADSHKWAADDFIKIHRHREPLTIVNFDAHHDMGYKPWKILKRDFIDRGRVDCATWLLVILSLIKTAKATVIYPEWKGEAEILLSERSWESNLSVKKRFQYQVFNENKLAKLGGNVDGVFVAKSSPWVPPWHDEAFDEFIKTGSRVVGIEAKTPYGNDNLIARTIDTEQLKAIGKLQNENLELLHARII